MADAEIIALLDHIKDIGERTERKIDSHIERDEKTNKEFLLPLWEEYQRRKGARAMAIAFYSVLSAGIATLVEWMHK